MIRKEYIADRNACTRKGAGDICTHPRRGEIHCLDSETLQGGVHPDSEANAAGGCARAVDFLVSRQGYVRVSSLRIRIHTVREQSCFRESRKTEKLSAETPRFTTYLCIYDLRYHRPSPYFFLQSSGGKLPRRRGGSRDEVRAFERLPRRRRKISPSGSEDAR